LEISFINHYKSNFIFDFKNTVKRFEKIAFFESVSIDLLNFTFVSDKEIILINTKFLRHNYPTDIITFDYSLLNIISGDIFISLDTILQNSVKFNTTIKNELNRVMIHGILHLIGYNDKKVNEKKLMRSKEDFYLRLFS
jgi:rRNA maturation RNase YbeY